MSEMLSKHDITKLLVDRGATLQQDYLLRSERSKYTPEQENQMRLDAIQRAFESEGGGTGGGG